MNNLINIPIADGTEMLSFDMDERHYVVYAKEFGHEGFQIVSVMFSDEQSPVVLAKVLLDLQDESNDMKDLRDQDHESDARFQEEA